MSGIEKMMNGLVLWNVEAVGLCSEYRESETRVKVIISKIINLMEQGKTACLVEWNLPMDAIREKARKIGYEIYFASKEAYAPPPTRENPDGVLLLVPHDKITDELKIEVMPHSVVGKAGAPWIRATDTSTGQFVVFAHLKSKTDQSHVRYQQLDQMGAFGDNCIGVIGDLNESSVCKDPILVIDKMKELDFFYDSPITNMKEKKKIETDERYKRDSRTAGENGMAMSTTDWIFYRTEKTKFYRLVGEIPDGDIYESADQWYALHNSDHRPIELVLC